MYLDWFYPTKKSNPRKKKCQISKLKGITYGPFSSNFKQYETEIISGLKIINEKRYRDWVSNFKHNFTHSEIILHKDLETKANADASSPLKKMSYFDSVSQRQVPFYGWECVSIIMESRTYDFVIQNDDHLFALMNFLQHTVIFMINKENRRKNPEFPIIVPSPMSKFPPLLLIQFRIVQDGADQNEDII
jgi:hypothetical protein